MGKNWGRGTGFVCGIVVIGNLQRESTGFSLSLGDLGSNALGHPLPPEALLLRGVEKDHESFRQTVGVPLRRDEAPSRWHFYKLREGF
jgi:hypothetical protein